jgi:plasmid maintenance system killer protein
VAVGLIIVEGPTSNLKFSAAERTKVVAEVQNGLTWLGSQSSPAGVSWFYDLKVITLNVPAGPANETFEQKEDRWRNPAMAQLGYGPGMAGVQDYVEKLRAAKGTDWAYCAFFTKYPLGWFAYASIGGPRLVMDYNNDGWGPDNIDRVFAHETGHIFNAPDEYASSGCTCGGQWGAFGVPNANCENCAPNGGVPCIMKGNTWEMCPYTPFHLGFPQGQRYSGVYQAASGSYGLWVNADWDHFVAKWQEWSKQGLRLDDLEISQPGGNLRYSGVFSQGSGGYGLWALSSWDSFVAKVGNDLRYSGVFRQGSGAYGLWVNADWNTFVAKWQEWSGKGLRLADLTVTQVGNQLRYSGVFNQGSGAYGLWALADWNSFVAKWQEWSKQGLRLVDLEITKVGNDTRYSGVFRQGSGGYSLWVNADWSSFVTKWNEWNSQGLRLVDFDITLTGIEAAASATAEDAARAAGEEAGAAGYGFLSADAAVGGDETSGAGFGAMSLAGAQEEVQETGGSGFGAASLDEASRADEQETGGAGYGAASIFGVQEDQEASLAGFGLAFLAGVAGDVSRAGGNGYGEMSPGG